MGNIKFFRKISKWRFVNLPENDQFFSNFHCHEKLREIDLWKWRIEKIQPMTFKLRQFLR